jgi:DNA-binding response OmpR family regulator
MLSPKCDFSVINPHRYSRHQGNPRRRCGLSAAREFQWLRYFTEHVGVTLSHDELLREVRGYDAATFTRTVDVHVARLRQKLEKDPKRPEFIVTVPGLGSKFEGGKGAAAATNQL